MSTTSDILLERLLHLHPKKIDLVLDRISTLLARLGHPEQNLPPIIHVAGTNGKGSTITFMRSILESADQRVHTYTSPHLVKFHERIRLAGADGQASAAIPEDELFACLAECEKANREYPITFFEITTAAAFLAFSQHPADIILLEVGLGGRFDATNVITRPAVSVITRIDHDHHDFLGSDLAGIAREKAGILKPNCPAVTGTQDERIQRVLENEAMRQDAPLKVCGQDFSSYAEAGRMIYQDDNGLLDLPLPKMIGHHQLENAGLAIAALRCLPDLVLSHDAIAQGIESAHWPARCQRLDAQSLPWASLPTELPEVWLDGGHNANAAEALAQAMGELEEKVARPLYLILGMMENKDADAFLGPFQTLAKAVIAVPIAGTENAAKPETLETLARKKGFPSFAAQTLSDALTRVLDINKAADQTDAPRILICGSLYLAGNVLAETNTPVV